MPVPEADACILFCNLMMWRSQSLNMNSCRTSSQWQRRPQRRTKREQDSFEMNVYSIVFIFMSSLHGGLFKQMLVGWSRAPPDTVYREACREENSRNSGRRKGVVVLAGGGSHEQMVCSAVNLINITATNFTQFNSIDFTAKKEIHITVRECYWDPLINL